jgi:hypothetical protein
MDSRQVLTTFNNHFLEFVNDVQQVFPNDVDISTIHNAFTKMRKANPKLIMMTFKEHVLEPYRKEIETGDIEFFISKDYRQDVGNNNMILEKIDCLRGPIREMNTEEQQKVVKYLQNLCKLCDLYK